MLKRVIGIMGLLLCSPALADLPAPEPCPVGFYCSYTFTVAYAPAIPATITVNFYSTLGGSIERFQTIHTSSGQANFEVTGGKWYVQIRISADDGSIQPTVVEYVIQYPTLLEPIGQPSAPSGFSIK